MVSDIWGKYCTPAVSDIFTKIFLNFLENLYSDKYLSSDHVWILPTSLCKLLKLNNKPSLKAKKKKFVQKSNKTIGGLIDVIKYYKIEPHQVYNCDNGSHNSRTPSSV